MSLSISWKLVGAFVGLTALVLAATLGLARWSFEQGFLDYVNALEQTRLERLQLDLGQEYLAAGGNWQRIDNRRFAMLLHRSAPGGLGAGQPAQEGRPGRPPPAIGPAPPRSIGGGLPPTALYDIDGNLVAGAGFAVDDNGEPTIRVPVFADGREVGELRSEPRRRLTSPQETEFSRRQLQTSWLLGISSLVLAVGVSMLLARGLLAPVRRMITGVSRLSSGDYGYRMNEDRGDELGDLTRDLDRLGSTLEASQSARKRLLADISHELRTPLTVLSGEVEALKDGLRAFDREQLDSLDQEVQRLRYLVDDLYELSVSDLGGLSYSFSTLRLDALLRDAVEGMARRATEAGLTLELLAPDAADKAVTVEADGRRLEQLIHNLLENSLAYTDAPGKVEVTFRANATRAHIVVEDTAPGVTDAECTKLFDPLFRQEASRNRRTGGAGLGLAICRNIVVAHQGSIEASPSDRGGLKISVNLPLAGASEA